MKVNRKVLVTAILAATFSFQSIAQQPVLEEVIVVAQKRESNLQDTAIAITAIGSETFDSLNIQNPADYENFVPSLSVRPAPQRLFIRGVGRITNSLGTEPGVAVYLDQIYSSEFGEMGRSNSLTTERVEILRGPQGTLFGRNATGGAVNIVSKRPADEFEHHARAKVGSYDELNWGLSSSGPVSDNLGYRVFAFQNKRDGYVDNLAGGDIYSLDTTSIGAQFDWDLTDTVNLWVSYNTYETDIDTLGGISGGHLISKYNTEEISTDGFLLGEPYQWDQANPAVRDPYKVDVSDIGRAKTDDVNRFIAHLTWDLDALTIKYVGGYSEGDFNRSNSDLGYTSRPDNRVVENSIQTRESQSHEIQFLSPGDGNFNWVAGVYFSDEETDQPFFIASLEAEYLENTLPTASFNPAEIAPNPGRIQYFQRGTLDYESQAAYADLNYQFNDSWKLTFGVRYSEDEKKGYEEQRLVLDPNVYGIDYTAIGFGDTCCGWLETDNAVANRKLKDDWDNTSGRVVLDWTPDDDTLVYASVSTGYKSGGFRLGNLDEEPYFDPEDLTSYEIGYKASFNDTLRLNAVLFFYDYKDMQVLVPSLTEENLAIPRVVNADKAEVTGFEIEATWLATENLELFANYSYLDGEYTDFCCAVDTIEDPDGEPQDLSGTPLVQTPQNKIFLGGSYSWRTESAGEFILLGSYAWIDERQYDVFENPETIADSYERVDATLTWFSPGDAWRVILSGKNLTDDFTWENLERLNNTALAGVPNLPRTYGLEVQYTLR